VPLGLVQWGFTCDAVNTLSGQATTGTNWSVLCPAQPQQPAPNVQNTTTFPTWTTVFKNSY
jgi:hypothetical protein